MKGFGTFPNSANAWRSTCGDTPYGYGIATISGSVSVSNFVVTDAATCGVFIEGEVGELDLSTGIVSGAPIGACVQLDGYDLTRRIPRQHAEPREHRAPRPRRRGHRPGPLAGHRGRAD